MVPHAERAEHPDHIEQLQLIIVSTDGCHRVRTEAGALRGDPITARLPRCAWPRVWPAISRISADLRRTPCAQRPRQRPRLIRTGRRPSSGLQRADLVENGSEAAAFHLKVIAALQIQPEPFRCAEVAGEPERRICADAGTAPVTDAALSAPLRCPPPALIVTSWYAPETAGPGPRGDGAPAPPYRLPGCRGAPGREGAARHPGAPRGLWPSRPGEKGSRYPPGLADVACSFSHSPVHPDRGRRSEPGRSPGPERDTGPILSPALRPWETMRPCYRQFHHGNVWWVCARVSTPWIGSQ